MSYVTTFHDPLLSLRSPLKSSPKNPSFTAWAYGVLL